MAFTSGDQRGWAIDEDLRQLRLALAGIARETSATSADVIHSPFWMGLNQYAPDVLATRTVVANADNPPFFYLRQPEFAAAQRQVNLWIARSREAVAQFQALRLPVEYVPYATDPGIFHPLARDAAQKRVLRKGLGLPEGETLIANFHRDSEGGDLSTPKMQKAPELLFLILKKLRDRGHAFTALLAGPRRHWLRGRLREEGIPYHFVGEEIAGDDFGRNILDRATLNKLYAAADYHIVPSRWEGGPQSLMEAAACRCKTLSTPVGLAAEILEARCLFRTADHAVEILEKDIASGYLDGTVDLQEQRFHANHSTSMLPSHYRRVYEKLARSGKRRGGAPFAQFSHWARALSSRFEKPLKCRAVTVLHEDGRDGELDEILSMVRASLTASRIKIHDIPVEGVPVIAGWQAVTAQTGKLVQFISPSTTAARILPDAVVVAPAVQDCVNLRAAGIENAMVAIPFFSPDRSAGPIFRVAPGDGRASLRIWRALAGGSAVLYPASSAYYEQVFHAGLPYGDNEETGDTALKKSPSDFDFLRKYPSQTSSLHNLLRLLISL